MVPTASSDWGYAPQTRAKGCHPLDFHYRLQRECSGHTGRRALGRCVRPKP